jgi:hypothetical protein
MSTIPKVIYLTSCNKNIPNYVCSNWKKLNPEYDIKLYDDNDCIEFLEKEFGKEYTNIFNYIKDGPIKSDFFRVCILYLYGGVYSDIDIEPLIPIKDFLEEDVDFLTSDSRIYSKINPHIIIAAKNNHILKKCIDKYMYMYMNELEYSYWGWSIVNIMTPILNKELNIEFCNKYMKINEFFIDIFSLITSWDIFKTYANKTFIKGEHKYQFLQEVSVYNRNYLYCSYKGNRILNNRYNNYCRMTHKFLKNE